MKKKNNLILLLSLLLFASCEDYLDKTPDEDMTLDDVFSDPIYADNFLTHIYSWIPTEANFADDGGAWRSPFVGGCDEMEIAYGGAFSHQINSGAWNPNNITRVPVWNETYMATRKVNMFLENLNKVPVTEAEKAIWKGEAHFLRAYFHFLSFRVYGPIILLDRSLNLSDNMLGYSRSPIDECISFMAADCDSAAALLPDRMPSTDTGRATRVAALALKSRLLLYAASPLYNGNSAYTDFKDSTGLQLIPGAFDGTKWQKAAAAAKACIDAAAAAGYGLYKSVTNDPVQNYQELFLKSWNKEILFAKNLDRYSHYLRCADPISLAGFSIINPTQEQVDAYEMENGLAPVTGYTNDGLTPVINLASGYREDGYAAAERPGRWPAGVSNMFVGREPRFYASINFPGQFWKNYELQFWFDGIDGKRFAGSDYCKTGYLMRKIVDPTAWWNPYIVPQTTWIIARLAEIYLNYAEALNESSGPVADVYAYVNAVRERSGLPGLPSGLSKEQMRDKIKHERRIELAFETHRYFDVRRWEDAQNSENKPIHSLNIFAGANKQDNNFYKRIKVEDRIFENPKHYFFPIAQDEIDKNLKGLMQNPGW